MVAGREAGVIEVFEDEEPTGVIKFCGGDGLRDARLWWAVGTAVAVPGEFDLVGAEFTLVGAVGGPAAWVVSLSWG